MNYFNITEALRSALEHYQKGDYRQAEYICREIINIDPENAEAYYMLGIVLQSKNQFDDAIRCYQEATRINPQHFSAHFQLGIALYNRRQLDEAIASLESALLLNPNFDEAYCSLGMIFRERGQHTEAINYFQRAIQLNPKSAWAYTNLSIIFNAKGYHDEAKAYFQKALEHNTNIANPENNLGILLKEEVDSLNLSDTSQETSALSILISVPVYNRKTIAQLSLAQTKRYKTSKCYLQVYNDHSNEFDNSFLKPYADEVIQLPEKMGIDKLRWHQFKKYLETDFDCLYMTDSDVIHDPHYITMLHRLYETGRRQLPVSLFNSIFTMQPRMILYFRNGIILKSTAPGNSMFYDRKMVVKILDTLNNISGFIDYLPWDNKAIACLGLPWITPEVSYLEHYGAQGVNNDNYERDRAITPTEYLRARREPILKYLADNSYLRIDW